MFDSFPIATLDPILTSQIFREIPLPPKKLTYRGTLPNFEKFTFLTVIGSRNYSAYGKEVCEYLISSLKGFPVIIVSGLALGIDSIAHECALNHGMTTIAFPGSGLDESVLYPKTNHFLAKKILENNGCIISECYETQPATDWTFPKRNRLMAGISRATLIIEATHKSGSRITAKLATEYNRDVLAVPGSILSTHSEGPNELIRLGATPITCPGDLIEALGLEKVSQPTLGLIESYSSEEKHILSLLGAPLSKNELIRISGLPISKVLVLLSEMEIKGLIKEIGEEIFKP